MSPPRLLALVSFLATLAPQLAHAASHAPAPPGAVRFLLPTPGTELRAGEEVVLEWAPGPEFDRLGRVEEWEAFLSLDGGASHPIRLTPHLDRGRRRVRVRLPEFASPEARLLLRFGDERRELEAPWPGLFVVAPPRAFAFRPRELRPGGGERARPGGAPTWAWVEGGRDGSAWREVQSLSLPTSIGGLPCVSGTRPRAPASRAPRPPRPHSPQACPRSPVPAGDLSAGLDANLGIPREPFSPHDVRRLIGRWNE